MNEAALEQTTHTTIHILAADTKWRTPQVLDHYLSCIAADYYYITERSVRWYYTNGDWPREIIVAQGRRPRATMIPRGNIPLCCTLSQSPFVLLYILFGRDGWIHGHKPLAFIIHLIWHGWANSQRQLLVSAAAMMSTSTYGYWACAKHCCTIMTTWWSAIARNVARNNGRSHNVSRPRTNKAVNWILLPDKVTEWGNSIGYHTLINQSEESISIICIIILS